MINQNKNAHEFMPEDEESITLLGKRFEQYFKPASTQDELKLENQYVKFMLGKNSYFGIDYQFSIEVLSQVLIAPVPYLPGYVDGVFNHRGAILAAINLNKFFQLGTQGEKSEIIIVENDKVRVGFLVNTICGFQDYNKEMLITSKIESGSLTGEFVHGIDISMVSILNCVKILSVIGKDLQSNKFSA